MTASERAVAHPVNKLVPIARPASRSFKLITLHLDGFAHLLNALCVASGLTGPEQDSANCAQNGRESRKPKGVWGKELPDKGNQRSPL